MAKNEPLTNGGNRDRDGCGRFAKGNAGGPGNPHGRAAAQLRVAMYATVKPGDIAAILKKTIALARGGEPWAVKEILDRVLGRPGSTISVIAEEQLDEQISGVLGELANRREA